MGADDKTRIAAGVANTAVGTQLSGIYELDERIAFGGMGEVYRGHNIQTGDHVAIKIVLPEFARDQTILSLFRKEASILNHLSHDAIVRYHVFTIDPGIGRPYLAMEFVDGESLFDVMRHGAMPAEEVRKLCYRLASGLSAVHQAGAIHRDLSPDNIILPGGRVDRAKIVDFGIARSATVGGETLIGGKFAGKYNYVSPEQLGLYGGEVSERSDIYSLGLVLVAVLRGKPIDMSGSQFEILEKRRVVPDLSDIDEGLRDIVEAMLQPDPRDRPASMADIARMTRDDDEETTPPTSFAPRDRPGLPRAGQTLSPGPKVRPSSVQDRPAAGGLDAQRFVPHVRPAHLSEPRPSAAARPAKAAKPDMAKKPAKTLTITIATLATVAVVSGAGFYLSGLMIPAVPTPSKTSEVLKPAPPKTAPEPAKPAPTDDAANTGQPAKTVQPARPQTETSTPAAENQAEAALPSKPEPTQPAHNSSQTKEPAELSATKEQQPLGKAPTSVQPDTMAGAPPAERQADATAVQQPEPARPPIEAPSRAKVSGTETQPLPEKRPTSIQPDTVAGASQAERQADAIVAQQPEPARPTEAPSQTKAPSAAETQPVIQPDTAAGDNQQSASPPTRIAPAQPVSEKAATPPTAQPDVSPALPQVVQSQEPEPPASQPAAPKAAAPAPEPNQADVKQAGGQKVDLPAAKQPDEPKIALNVPKPETPPTIGDAVQQASWVRDFGGGDCFFATTTSSTDNAPAIEGFGTAVGPFERLLGDFKAKFHVEPDISVRLIEPSQCEVTNFLRSMGQTEADKPKLVLDRTLVPSGTSISGTLTTRGGLISSVLLIDHKGMVFNLDDRIVVQSDKATFNIPISLGATGEAAGKAVPQIIMVITGPQDLRAAVVSTPTPASVVLPKILEEIETDGSRFSATAKYFRLGG